MVTQEELQQMGVNLAAMREEERELLAKVEDVQLRIRRQEGAIQFAQWLLQRAQAATNGAADPQHAA